MLRKFFLTCGIYLGLSVSAIAADVPQRGPSPAPVISTHNWTGFFVGVHAAYQSGKVTGNCPFIGCNISMSPNSVLGGVQAGYNHQFSNNVVLGAWALLPLVNASSTQNIFGANFTGKIRWAATAGLRLGYAFDRVLPYVHAGLIIGGGRATNGFTGISSNQTHTGYTIGGGIEYALTNNWSATLGYSYNRFDNQAYTNLPVGVRVGYEAHVIGVGLAYTFKPSHGGVVAKY